jgi:hypothetical protein
VAGIPLAGVVVYSILFTAKIRLVFERAPLIIEELEFGDTLISISC